MLYEIRLKPADRYIQAAAMGAAFPAGIKAAEKNVHLSINIIDILQQLKSGQLSQGVPAGNDFFQERRQPVGEHVQLIPEIDRAFPFVVYKGNLLAKTAFFVF